VECERAASVLTLTEDNRTKVLWQSAP